MDDAEPLSVKSARRVLEVLELFAALKAPASAKTVQQLLGYPQSSTSVLLKSLVSLGYLAFDATERVYAPTVRVSQLGSWMHAAGTQRLDVQRLMETMRELTGDTVFLGMQSDVFVQYVTIIHSNAPIRLHIQPGTMRPLCRTALGKMLLSRKSDAEVALLVRRINSVSAPDERIDPASLLTDLGQYRRQGFCINAGSVIPEIGQVAMLIPTASNHPAMAIGVGGLLREVSKRWDFIVEAMKHAISEATALATRPPEDPLVQDVSRSRHASRLQR